MNRLFRLILTVLLPIGVLLGFEVIRDLPTAYSNGADIVLSWRTVDESGVARFEILRRTGTEGEFLPVGVVTPLRVNNSSYEYIDRQVFKIAGGIYQYKIRVVMDSNTSTETPPVTVSHLSSAARRTWGSIKAMFR
jgi:hypothetical protein